MAQTLTSPGQSASILSQIGGTPLIRLERIAAELSGIQIYCKAEYFNPGGSVKDRPALSMILDGERTGKLDKRRTILDSTSGNTGIAYAMVAAGTFRAWILAQFGEGLADVFLLPYNRKVWAYDSSLLGTGWVGERVAPVDLPRILRCRTTA